MDIYVSKNLAKGEQLLHITHPHWIVFIEGLAIILVALLVGSGSFVFKHMGGIEYYLGLLLLLVGTFRLVVALLYFVGTELGVTNKRIIGKVGIIMRTTVEIDHNRVESINIDQSVLGRLLDYGTVTIRGLGGTPIPVHTINHPLAFRNARLTALEHDERKDITNSH